MTHPSNPGLPAFSRRSGCNYLHRYATLRRCCCCFPTLVYIPIHTLSWCGCMYVVRYLSARWMGRSGMGMGKDGRGLGRVGFWFWVMKMCVCIYVTGLHAVRYSTARHYSTEQGSTRAVSTSVCLSVLHFRCRCGTGGRETDRPACSTAMYVAICRLHAGGCDLDLGQRCRSIVSIVLFTVPKQRSGTNLTRIAVVDGEETN